MPMMLTDLLILPAIPAAMYVTPAERKTEVFIQKEASTCWCVIYGHYRGYRQIWRPN